MEFHCAPKCHTRKQSTEVVNDTVSSVNKPWDAMIDEVKLEQLACEQATLIADGEKAIRRSLQTENMTF